MKASDKFGWSEQRVGLFVDTQNLYYAARDGAGYGGQGVNYETLLTLAAGPRCLQQATAYVVERPGEATAYGFVTKLSALGYRVRRRTLRLRHVDDTGRPVLDGDWDMGIAADMVRAWDHLDVLVLASGDGDFVPMLDLAQARGLRVEVLAFREVASQALIDLADRFVHLPDVADIFV